MATKWLSFVYLPTFERAVKKVDLSVAEQRKLELTLVNNPEEGAVIVGTGGFRKMRLADAGGGKSGGFRVVYYYRTHLGRVYLMTVYKKNVKETLTNEEKNQLKELTKLLERER